MFKRCLIVIFLVIVDQISKIAVSNPIKNYGLAFGLFPGYTKFYILLTCIVVSILVYYLFLGKEELRYGLAFLVGGSLGNLIDRLFLGYVRDFITFGFWPSFNFADIFNVIGVILIIKYSK